MSGPRSRPELHPWRTTPIRDDVAMLARAAIGGIGVVAIMIFINWGLPVLAAWWAA